MNIRSLVLSTLPLWAAFPALAQQKIGVIQMQAAIVGTKDGQKAVAEFEAKMAPRRKDLDAKQNSLRELQEKLQKLSPTDPNRAQMTRDADAKGKDFQRSLDDAKADFQSEQDQLLNALGAKVLAVMNKYAKDNGYSLVVDVSNPQTPVMYASEAIDITKTVVEYYDKSSTAPAPPATKK